MATVYSGWVATDDFRAVLDYSISYPNATQAKITLTGKINSNYGYSSATVNVTLACGGQSYSAHVSGFSSHSTKTIGSHSFTVTRTSSKQSIAVSAKVTVADGTIASYRAGATAKTTVSCAAITYSAPAAPSSCTAVRNSDVKATVKWTNGSTSTTTPRSAIYVERQVDSGSFVQVAKYSANANGYIDNSTSANHRYRYRVRSYGAGGYSGYATSGYVYTTPARPSSVIATTVGFNSVRISITGSIPYADAYEFQYTTNGATWSETITTTSFPFTITPPAGRVQFRVISVLGSLRSGYTLSNIVATICPPLAPAVTLDPGKVAAAGHVVNVTWVPNHPDSTEPTAVQIEQTINGDVSVTTLDDPKYLVAYAFVPTEIGDYSIRVRTKGLHANWGAWSDASTFTVAYPPEITIELPASDGATVTSLPLDIEWSVVDATGISMQTLQLLDSDGDTVWMKSVGPGVSGATSTYSITAADYSFTNNTDYTVEVSVRGGSSLSTTEARLFSTAWTAPAEPHVDVEYGEGLDATITVDDGVNYIQREQLQRITGRKGQLLPGLKVYGNTTQNLLEFTRTQQVVHGLTMNVDSYGYVAVFGTADDIDGGNIWIPISKRTERGFILRPNKTYTLTVYGTGFTDDTHVVFYEHDKDDKMLTGHVMTSTSTNESITFTTNKDYWYGYCAVEVKQGATVGFQLRVMLAHGDQPAQWVPPGINTGIMKKTDVVYQPYGMLVPGGNIMCSTANTYILNGVTVDDNHDGTYHVYGTPITNSAFDIGLKMDNLIVLPVGTVYTVAYTGWEHTYFKCNTINKYGNVAWLFPPVGAYNNTSVYTGANYGYFSGSPAVYVRFACITVKSGMKGVPIDETVTICISVGDEPLFGVPEPISTFNLPNAYPDHCNLASVPDGTEDELRVDENGNCTLVVRTATYTIPSDQQWANEGENVGGRVYYNLGMDVPSPPYGVFENQTLYQYCDKMPIRVVTNSNSRQSFVYQSVPNVSPSIFAYTGTGTTTVEQAAQMANGGTYIYKRNSQKTVDVGTIEMPTIPSDDCYLWVVAPVPLDIELMYPDVESFDVVRVAADHGDWLVDDGLAAGDNVTDPLPPIGVDYAYTVTARTSYGITSTTTVAAHVDSGGKGALNFGASASEFVITQFDLSWGDGYEHAGELIHFATDDGMPLFYATSALDNSGTYAFTLIGEGVITHARELFHRYAVGWLRLPDGRRMRARMRASMSGSNAFIWIVDVKLDADEIQWGEIDGRLV